MKIPEKIQIGPYTFEVEFQKDLWMQIDTRGRFTPTNKKITLDLDMSEEYKQEVFLHEVLEAIKWTYDLRISHQDLNLIGLGLSQAYFKKKNGN